MSFVLRFFVALKSAKTFAIVVAVLTICILTPTVLAEYYINFVQPHVGKFGTLVFAMTYIIIRNKLGGECIHIRNATCKI